MLDIHRRRFWRWEAHWAHDEMAISRWSQQAPFVAAYAATVKAMAAHEFAPDLVQHRQAGVGGGVGRAAFPGDATLLADQISGYLHLRVDPDGKRSCNTVQGSTAPHP